MNDAETEIDDLRLDIATLNALVDAALDRSVRADDLLLLACSQVLRTRRRRLEALEQGLDPGPS